MIRKTLWQIDNPWIMIGLVILFAISSWQVYLLMHSEDHSKHGKSHQPDSIGYNLTLKRYDKTGFLTSISTSDKATHYPDTNITEFERVNMRLFNRRPEVSPWIISAPAGKAYSKGDKFELNGQVVMTQATYKDHPTTTVTTNEITILPNDKLIITDQPIAMQQPGLVLNAIGARYNYEQQVLNLLHQVVVDYQPQPKNKTL